MTTVKTARKLRKLTAVKTAPAPSASAAMETAFRAAFGLKKRVYIGARVSEDSKRAVFSDCLRALTQEL